MQSAQVTCGTELATLLVQASIDDGLKANEAALRRVLRILDTFEACSSGSSLEYSSIARSAIKWVQASHGQPELAERLHAKVAKYIWTSQHLEGLRAAMDHYCRSKDAAGFAGMLGQVSKVCHRIRKRKVIGRDLLVPPGISKLNSMTRARARESR